MVVSGMFKPSGCQMGNSAHARKINTWWDQRFKCCYRRDLQPLTPTGDLRGSSGLFESEPMRSVCRTFWNCFWCDLELISNRHQSLLLSEIVELESTLRLLQCHSELAFSNWILILSVFLVLLKVIRERTIKCLGFTDFKLFCKTVSEISINIY